MSRTSGSSRRCVRPCTPAPTIVSTRVSSRARMRADKAAAAEVLSAVISVPSMTATQAPVSASNSPIKAMCDGRPSDSLPSKTLTTLTPM